MSANSIRISGENITRELIVLDRVTRHYRRGDVFAIRDVSLTIQTGEYIAITGPSGSGKTTLHCLASGLEHPTSGRVLFEGQEPKFPSGWTGLRARRIGIVFQSFHLIPGLTAAENVELPMFGVISGEALRRRRVLSLLARVGLDQRARHRVSEMSGGECQRAAIARALANSPSVLFADEPTGNLDSRTASDILSLLETLNREEGVALVVITHDIQISERALRIIRLLDGQIIGDERRDSRP
jgi:putative ABC transport system ATP-binding protein